MTFEYKEIWVKNGALYLFFSPLLLCVTCVWWATDGVGEMTLLTHSQTVSVLAVNVSKSHTGVTLGP